MKKLKSSLKQSRLDSPSPSASSSTSSISSTFSTTSNSSSSNTYKFVRFAPQLTTVKSFHVNDEPISISNETSPIFYPIDNVSPFSSITPNFPSENKLLNKKYIWDLNFDDIEDDFDLSPFDNYNITYTDTPTNNTTSFHSFNKHGTHSSIFNMETFYNSDIKAIINNSNFKNGNSNRHLDSYEQVKVVNVSLLNDYIIRGTIKVRNLQYEKFIQCKFTFDNWKQIHYIKANYSFSPTCYEDVFVFDIDLNSWKFYLEYNNLIDATSTNNENNNLALEFVCMYSINDTIYYDNNNYQNFILHLNVSPKLNDSISPVSNSSNSHTSINTMTVAATAPAPSAATANPPLKNTGKVATRKFSKDTDYYNDSPLKHLFHTDTYWIHPKNQNKLSFFVDKQAMLETNHDTSMNKYNTNKNATTTTITTTTAINNNGSNTPSLSSSYSDLSSWDTDDSENEYYFDCYDYDYTFSPVIKNINNTVTATKTTSTRTTGNLNNPYQYNNSLTNNNDSTDTLLCFNKKWDDRGNIYNTNNDNNHLDNEDNETITSTNELNNSISECVSV